MFEKPSGPRGTRARIWAIVFGLVLVAAWRTALSPAVEKPGSAEFPPALVDFVPGPVNPVFEGRGAGHWDAKIRERGWILREGDTYQLWYTGYDGTKTGIRLLGHATSTDGIHWTRDDKPAYDQGWVEDMMVVKHDGRYYMFAEGLHDQAQLLTSDDGRTWTRQGQLDIRYTNGSPLTPGPYGTPTAWYENGTWYLLYERGDKGDWLATSKDLKVWTNVQDEPVIVPGPDEYDRDMIAINQVIKHGGLYYAYYHGAAVPTTGNWTSGIAVSKDRVHWKKYPGNPLFRDNKSSPMLVDDGKQLRLYTMHDKAYVHFPREAKAEGGK